MALVRKRLGEILLEAGMITEDQLEKALIEQKSSKKSLGQILIDSEFVTEQSIKAALELQFGISYVNIKSVTFTPELVELVPENLIRQRQLIPINFVGNNLTIAMVNPQDLPAIDDVRMAVSKKIGKSVNVRAVVITEDDFYSFLNEQFESAKETAPKGPMGISTDQEHDTSDILNEMELEEVDDDNMEYDDGDVEAAPIIRLANAILANAIKKGVSDIHIEPQEHVVRLRYRIDGVLHETDSYPKKIASALASRFKIITNLNIAEKRLPQDGRLRRRFNGRNIDFRVSTLPSKFGEKIVMRILDNSNTQLGLEILFQYPELLNKVRELVQRPYGIIFVCGPTGSGKTTSLYSILAERNTPDVNISTAEDPIEYDLAGITQTQAQPEIGLTFARILKAFLRQDPDIMLIGETRDKELAHIAIESALTGHLVFTSLHTNDAPGAITRLQEMGLDGFLIASSTVMVLAQRLVRRICSNCRILYEPEPSVIKFVRYPFKDDDGKVRVHKHNPEGCEKCSSGYKGRLGVYELMVMNDDLREIINKESNKDEIRIAARRNGMVPLMQFSQMLVRDGYTDFDEMIRVTVTDEGMDDPVPIQHFFTLDGEGVDLWVHNGKKATPEEVENMIAEFNPRKKKKNHEGDDSPMGGMSGGTSGGGNDLSSSKPAEKPQPTAEDLSPEVAAARLLAEMQKPKAALPAAGEGTSTKNDRKCPSCYASVDSDLDTCPYCLADL
jgi:type IV pilus assembly protein PilB